MLYTTSGPSPYWVIEIIKTESVKSKIHHSDSKSNKNFFCSYRLTKIYQDPSSPAGHSMATSLSGKPGRSPGQTVMMSFSFAAQSSSTFFT